MKKSLFLCILCVFLVSANKVSALSYKESMPESIFGSYISQSRLSEAKLLQLYVIRYTDKINTLYHSYSSEKSQMIQDANTILGKMSSVLDTIQEENISEEDAAEIMQSIVSDLKVLNTRVKVYLEQQKLLYEKKIEKRIAQYSVIGNRISKILDTLIDKMSRALIQKKSLTEDEKKIVQSLVNIRSENQKIKNFKNTGFGSESEIQIYFKNIIENIRREILLIKEYSR